MALTEPEHDRDDFLDFGKHFGTALKDVPRDYLKWMVKTMSDSEKLEWREWAELAQKELQYRWINNL